MSTSPPTLTLVLVPKVLSACVPFTAYLNWRVTLYVRIACAGLPQLPAGTYPGVVYIQAQVIRRRL